MKRIITISAVLTIVFYLAWAFVAWNIAWGIEISNWDSGERFLLAFFYPLYLLLFVSFINDVVLD